jgi:hypothetical protein
MQLLSFLYVALCPASVLFVFAFSFCFVRAFEEFGSPSSSLSCNESVLCCPWLPGVEGAASWHVYVFAFILNTLFRVSPLSYKIVYQIVHILHTQALFVSTVRRMVRGVDASDWVIYLFLCTFFVSVAPTRLLDDKTVCCWGILI